MRRTYGRLPASSRHVEVRILPLRSNFMSKTEDYRIEILMRLTQSYAPYTSLKTPVNFEMAESLARYLKRQGSAGRIMEVSSGKIIEEWP